MRAGFSSGAVTISIKVVTGLWHSADEKLTKCQVRGEVGSGLAPSGKASRANIGERGGVEKNGVALREQCEQVFRAEPLQFP